MSNKMITMIMGSGRTGLGKGLILSRGDVAPVDSGELGRRAELVVGDVIGEIDLVSTGMGVIFLSFCAFCMSASRF